MRSSPQRLHPSGTGRTTPADAARGDPAPPVPDGVSALRAEVERLRQRVRELEAARADEVCAERERVEQFAETTAGWFWETDAALRFAYMTPSVERVTGVEPEWHYGKSREDIGVPESVSESAWREHLDTLERRERFSDFVFRRDGPDGAKWLKTSGVPAFDGEGRFLGYRGTAVDITAEITARHTAEQLLSAVENLNDLFALWDENDRLVMCNERFREINAAVGETTEPGTPFADHIHAALAADLYPQAAGREEAWLEERFALHRQPGAAFEIERQEGRWLLIQEHQLADGATVTISTDITERKRVQLALEKQHSVLETTLATIPDGVQVLDAEGRLVASNPRLWEIMELDDGAILGASDPAGALREALAARGEQGPGAGDSDAPDASTREPARYERQLASGRWVECRWTPVPDGGSLAVYRDIDESKQLQRELERLATHDELTGLANRRLLFEILDHELARVTRFATPVSVLIIDADHFKDVNDRHGHALGDEVLQRIAAACEHTVRGIDAVGRLGGEEFAAVLPGTTLDEARIAAERVRTAVAALRIEHREATITPTVSIGVAEAAPDECAKALLARADEALYVAKRDGRNRVASR